MYVKGTRARTRVMKKMALKVWRIPSSPACTNCASEPDPLS